MQSEAATGSTKALGEPAAAGVTGNDGYLPHCTEVQMSLSGLEEIMNIREILKVTLGGNAEYNAKTAELLALIETWPALTAAVRAKIVKLIGVPAK